jgi:hypothetical protein
VNICKTIGKLFNKEKNEVLDYRVGDLYMLKSKYINLYHLTILFIMTIVRPFKIEKIGYLWQYILSYQDHRKSI